MKLNRTTSHLKQGDDSRFFLNVVTDLENQTSITNEKGNELFASFNSPIIGSIKLDRSREVVLTANNRMNLLNYEDGIVTILEEDVLFNFTEEYPVTGFHRVQRGCEDIIYFFDHNNPDRYYNVSRPEKHKTNGLFDITKTAFNPQVIHPNIITSILNSGGNLEYGTYNFAWEFLTSNEDRIFVSQVDINYTPIIYQVEGAVNISTNLPDIGGKPKSSKAIKITTTNIPEDAILARLIVFRHITSDGFTSDAHAIGQLIPVTTSTLEYVYTGFNVDNRDYFVDKNSYLVPPPYYHTSLDGIQVESRALRYNLKEAKRNIDEYQKYASKIHSKYVVSEVDKSNPNIYLLNQTLLGGEIILPCIEWVHTDGSVSNAYPCVGRAKLPNDEILVDDILNLGQQVEKWKYFDTSIKDGTPINGYVSSGEFGYYESTQLYSNPPNFCQSNYWGVDYEGNNLLDMPVRLFVVPDRSIEAHDVDDTIRPIGIWFDETTIEFPNEDVVGYYFSTVILSQSNIEAKGLGINSEPFINPDTNNLEFTSPTFTGFYNFSDSTVTNSTYQNLLTGNLLFNENYVSGTHVVKEGIWDWTTEETNKKYEDVFDDDLPYDTLRIYVQNIKPTAFISESDQAIKIEYSKNIPAFSITENIQNKSRTNTFNIVKLDNLFSNWNNKNFRYLSVRNDINPIPNIWSITTRRISNLNELVSFNGDNFITPLNIDNIAFVERITTQVTSSGEILTNFFIETKHNSFLRHNGTSYCNTTVNKEQDYFTFFFNKTVEAYNRLFKLRNSICPFFSGYNKDYSYVQDLNKYTSVGFTYDFCSECLNEYPQRIVFSPQSFGEDLADQYRILKANDYIDIPAHTGSIIKVDYKDGKLWVRTERATWLIQPNPQQMELSETTVQIGTGDFLSIPAREINVTPTGFGGQQHKLDSINCDAGLMWVDGDKSKIQLVRGEFNQVHQPLENWFNENIGTNQFRFGYDPMHNRILMTHKDKWTLSYCFKVDGWKSWHSYIPDWYLWDAETFYSFYDKSVYRHSLSNNFCEFYGLKFPHVVEFIIHNEGQTFIPQSIQYNAKVEIDENGYFQDVIDVTYDQMLCYNERQSTGLQNLTLDAMAKIYYQGDVTHVNQVDRNWKISPIKDLAVGAEIWTTDITPIKQGTQGWMDLLPQVNYNKPQVEIGQFRSKWVAVRLYFNDTTKKVTMEYIDSLKLNSIR